MQLYEFRGRKAGNLIGAGSHRLGGEVIHAVGRHHRAGGRTHGPQPAIGRLLEAHLKRVIVYCRGRVYRIHGRRDTVGPLLADIVNGKGGGVSVKGIAIGKGDALAQVESIGAGVFADIPRSGKSWGNGAVFIDAHEGLVHVVHKHGGDGGATGGGEIQRGGRRGGSHGEGRRCGVAVCLGGINHRGMARGTRREGSYSGRHGEAAQRPTGAKSSHRKQGSRWV